MRATLINITLKYKLPVESPDNNGVIYTQECIEKLKSQKIEGLPLLFNNKSVGVIKDAEITSENTMVANGLLWGGGTEETVEFETGGDRVVSMSITSYGFSEDVKEDSNY